MLSRAIFGQFISYDSFGNILPAVFESWQIGDHGRSYLFKINPKSFFQDGLPVTSEDVIFSFNFLADKNSLVSRYFQNIVGYEDYVEGKKKTIEGIKGVGTGMVQILLRKPSSIFLSQLADPKIVVLPDHLRSNSEKDFFRSPIGAGPYRLISISNDGKKVTLDRFEGFYGLHSNIRRYELAAESKSNAIEGFSKGIFDDLEDFPLSKSEVDFLKPSANVLSASSYSVNLLIFNGRKPFLQSENNRTLISNAIRGQLHLERCDFQNIPTDGVIPQGLLGWSTHHQVGVIPNEVSRLPSNNSKKLQRKMVLLAYGLQPPPCVIEPIVQALKQELGIDLVVDFRTETDAIRVFLNGDYDFLYENLSVRGPEPFNLFTFFDPESPHNLTYFKDAEISKQLSAVEDKVGGQRGTLYQNLSDYISNQKKYVVPLYTDVRVFLFGKNVKSDEIPATISGNTSFERVSL